MCWDVKSTKYRERPLIGKICDLDTPDSGRVEMEWMVGSLEGVEREGGWQDCYFY